MVRNGKWVPLRDYIVRALLPSELCRTVCLTRLTAWPVVKHELLLSVLIIKLLSLEKRMKLAIENCSRCAKVAYEPNKLFERKKHNQLPPFDIRIGTFKDTNCCLLYSLSWSCFSLSSTIECSSISQINVSPLYQSSLYVSEGLQHNWSKLFSTVIAGNITTCIFRISKRHQNICPISDKCCKPSLYTYSGRSCSIHN